MHWQLERQAFAYCSALAVASASSCSGKPSRIAVSWQAQEPAVAVGKFARVAVTRQLHRRSAYKGRACAVDVLCAASDIAQLHVYTALVHENMSCNHDLHCCCKVYHTITCLSTSSVRCC